MSKHASYSNELERFGRLKAGSLATFSTQTVTTANSIQNERVGTMHPYVFGAEKYHVHVRMAREERSQGTVSGPKPIKVEALSLVTNAIFRRGNPDGRQKTVASTAR